MDRGETALLGLLDLSAAYDTVDHGILLDRLYFSYGINGNALEWMRSYITNRTQLVSFNVQKSL